MPPSHTAELKGGAAQAAESPEAGPTRGHHTRTNCGQEEAQAPSQLPLSTQATTWSEKLALTPLTGWDSPESSLHVLQGSACMGMHVCVGSVRPTRTESFCSSVE